VKANEFIYKVENLFSRRWDHRGDWALVERIQDDIGGSMRLRGEHFFEAFYHSPITRLPFSMVIFRIQ
jgi:hypothetical protein